eukprot:scaffold137_cov398-Prasinococcus_capsulatus_cf.AAC.9
MSLKCLAREVTLGSFTEPRSATSSARCRSSFAGTRLRASARKPLVALRRSLRVHAGARENNHVNSASTEDEVELLQKVLEMVKANKEASAAGSGPAAPGDYTGPSFTVKTFNAISPVGLKKFPSGKYEVGGEDTELGGEPMGIMLRSHKLKEEEVPPTVRCIARCGAGTNNIPVARMTELGIPVFNTPGANANAVKELVICGLLLASRGILEGYGHVKDVINVEEDGEYDKIATRIEKDKKNYVGVEITGRTLGVVGLGNIGARVAEAALALGMKVIGYDPALSVDAALRLPGDRMERTNSLEELLKESDYVSLHVPYIKGVTHHLIDAEALKIMKPNVSILNFARGEIVDGAALKAAYDRGEKSGKYISDFSDPALIGHSKHMVLPHLGASTAEAEENSAAMAAETIMDFLESGTIRNSVNFPTTILEPKANADECRLCIVNVNESGVLGDITSFIGSKGINISQQINTSRGDVAYTVIDMSSRPQDPAKLQAELAEACHGKIISSRFLGKPFSDNDIATPGTYFYVSWA